MAIVAVTAGCSQEPVPIPEAQQDLIGVWRHDSMRRVEGEPRGAYVLLKISAAGMLAYAWQETGEGVSLCSIFGGAALTHVDGQRLEAGPFWPLTTGLGIDRGPHRAGDRWSMTVEGIELERVSDSVERLGHGFSCEDGRLVPSDGTIGDREGESGGGGDAI